MKRAFYLEAWNGDNPHTVDRIGRGSIYVPACCVSVLGGIQPARLRQYLNDAITDTERNDGLFQRLQVLVWPDFSFKWKLVDRLLNGSAANRAAQVYSQLAELSADEPAKLRFADDAQELYEWWGELELKVWRGDLHPALIAHVAKYRKPQFTPNCVSLDRSSRAQASTIR